MSVCCSLLPKNLGAFTTVGIFTFPVDESRLGDGTGVRQKSPGQRS